MIFASDLDRTLIFSKRFSETASPEDVVLIETSKGREVSYMMKEALSFLEGLNERVTFVPVTTRSEDEYNRIDFVSRIQPRYAIVANGGKILIDGVEDPEWKEYILQTKKNLSCSAVEMKKTFLSLFPEEQFDHYKLADDLFWMFKLKEEPLDEKAYKWAGDTFKEFGWDLTKIGLKVYLLPSELTKWKALSFLKAKLSEEIVVAAGDSLMDYEMVSNADFGITPPHGAIHQHGLAVSPIILTESTGIPSGLELLKTVETLRQKHTSS